MPKTKTQIKKLIKSQNNTRKNDIKGGAGLFKRFRRNPTPDVRENVPTPLSLSQNGESIPAITSAPEPKKKFGTRLRNLAFRVGKALERFKLTADEKLFGDIPLIPNDFYKPEYDGDSFIVIKKQIKKAFKYEDDKGIQIPNYPNYKHYTTFTPLDVFILKKDSTSDRIPCVEGIFNISELIINDTNNEVILIVKNDGYSAVFSSFKFIFIVKPDSS
jgi:hypothetical protein